MEEKMESMVIPARSSPGLQKMKSVIQNVLLALCGAAFLSCTVTFFMNGFDISRMHVFGYRMSFVLSESMEPEIMTHALCLTDMVHKDAVVGDVVVYKHAYENGPTILVVHRIIEITDDGIITKGDNNEKPDDWITPKVDIIGKIVYVWNGFAKIYEF